jgi:hypothetical protein
MVHCSSRGEEGASAGGSDASLDSITGLDAGSPSDANPGIDLAHDAGSRPSDASADGYADAALCPSVAQACGDAANADVGCATTWSTAEQPSTWCPKDPYVRVFRATHCDGFNIVVLGSADTSSFYYYDLQSGALVGIEGHSLGGTRCVAGLSPDVPLTDCYEAGAVVTVTCESDGSFSD